MAKIKIEVTIASWWQKVDEAPKNPSELLRWYNELRSVTNKFRSELKRRETNLEKAGYAEMNPDWKPSTFGPSSKARIKTPTQEHIEAAQQEATGLMMKLKETPTLRDWKKIRDKMHKERIDAALKAAGVSQTEWGEFYKTYKEYHYYTRYSQGSDDAVQLERLLLSDEEWQEKLLAEGLEEVIQEWLGLRSTPQPGNPEDVF